MHTIRKLDFKLNLDLSKKLLLTVFIPTIQKSMVTLKQKADNHNSNRYLFAEKLIYISGLIPLKIVQINIPYELGEVIFSFIKI